MSDCFVTILVGHWNGRDGTYRVMDITGKLPSGVRIHKGGTIRSSCITNALRGRNIRSGQHFRFKVQPGGKYKFESEA